ncbi:MAG: hypothetical protein ACXWU2_12710, partial [Allosphingosinicella sp.]
AYFEQRNLRELDRVAAELNATSESLAQAAALHFVPQQLHFALSPQLECLIATTELTGARQRPITITYAFTDPDGSNRIASWYAAEAARLPAAPAAVAPAATAPAGVTPSAAPPVAESRELPANICGYRRPLGQSAGERTTIEGGALQVERPVRLSSLLVPMTPRRTPDNLDNCYEGPNRPGEGAAPTDPRSFIRRCYELAAREDLRDLTYSRRDPSEVESALAQSLDAAFRSNSVWIKVSTPMEALDFDAALEKFDAVQVIGQDPAAPDRPVLLYQAGRVPAAIEDDELVATNPFGGVLGAGDPNRQTGQPPPAGQPRREEPRSFLIESQVERSDDLVLFQRTVPRLAGLSCSPCRIVGIVKRGNFDRTVRRIDGVHATMFLIGVLTLIGLIPLLQLKLRRRLDAMGRPGQYLLWFSLTLLSASAAVSTLAIWSSAASRSAGGQYAEAAITDIDAAFATEMTDTIEVIRNVVGGLEGAGTVFPAPTTLPTPDAAQSTQPVPGLETLQQAWQNGSNAAIIETISHFRDDGLVDRESARLATSRLPAYGTSIAGRAYFQRARNCEYDLLPRPDAPAQEFVLDRVFARPDGAPRVVWLLPTKQTCRFLVERNEPVPVTPVLSRTDFFHDPTRQAFILASGSLRTFLRTELAPGFDFAVIDPRRGGGEANVLFHSRRGAELVERFQNEIDNPDEFAAMVRELRTARPGPADREAAPGTAARGPALRLDTNYRGQPARLTAARLHPNMDWILVIIEDRNDAGYAIWRAATFGYGMWFIAVLLVGGAMLISHWSGARSFDRRPGLWLWPRNRLTSFTPPLIERHVRIRAWLDKGAWARDRHILYTLLAGIIGIPSAEGASRVLLAFGIGLTVLASRAHFRGLTAVNDRAARRRDRRSIAWAGFFLVIAVVLFVPGMIDEYRFGGFGGESRFWPVALVAVRVLLFAGTVAILARVLQEAWPHSAPDADGATAEAATLAAAEPPATARPRVLRWDVGWMAALMILGGMTAAAAFLDSHDYDHRLAAEREDHLKGELEPRRRQAVNAIINARVAPLPRTVVAQIVDTPLSPMTRLGLTGTTSGCLTLSCLSIRYLGLREQAQEYSDFAPYQMRDPGTTNVARIGGLLILVLLPSLALLAAFVVFRQQYFRSPPRLSPGKDPEFDPPLSLTREQFIAEALVPASQGKPPQLPFAAPGGSLHLILGAGLDLRDDPTATRGQRLGDLKGIHWVDLLNPSDGIPSTAKAVVIGNLDLALQVPDELAIARTYRTLRDIAGSAGARPSNGRHIFLLAEIDPLDRISLLWQRHSQLGANRLVEGWRWAELIQDFTMFPLRPGAPVAVDDDEPRLLRTIKEELGVLDTSFARELRDQLLARMGPVVRAAQAAEEEAAQAADETAETSKAAPADKAKVRRDDEDRIMSFITEQMSDHYHKLWAGSSDEERVILYRVASDCHLKMHDFLGLRSLLARGLLIRVPEYRLINRSFARYVMRVGAPSEIRRSAEQLEGVDRIWPLIRYPLAAIAASAVLLLQFVAPSSGGAAVGALPALLALV